LTHPIPALVVGSGFGCRIHVPALRAAGFEVVGLVGNNPGKTEKRAGQNAIPAWFTDLKPSPRLAPGLFLSPPRPAPMPN
jgi:predicted dehydrogenase